jgi:5-formyltetrahydrofolate cyclo-ligase
MADPDDHVTLEKAELRASLRQARALRSPVDRAHDAQSLSDHALAAADRARPGASLVSCYWSMPTEPGTDDLIHRLIERGTRVLVPRVASGSRLEWLPAEAAGGTVTSAFGIREPSGGSPHPSGLADCAVIFLPALAVDSRGCRLGQGGGYYDRALAGLPRHAVGGPVRIALVFADELLPSVPSAPHDIKVDAIATPSGVSWITSR